MKQIISIFLFGICLSSFSQSEKDSSIRRMLMLQGTEENYKVVIESLLKMQKKNAVIQDENFWKKVEENFISESMSMLFDSMIPIYSKYLSFEDIQAINAFYETEHGQNLIKHTPEIMQEAMKVGEAWGKTMSEQILYELDFEKEQKFMINLEGCENLKTGKFVFRLNDSVSFYYERNKKTQIEEMGPMTNKYDIEWLDDCRYKLVLKKTNNNLMEEYIGQETIINIFEINKDHYKYIAKQPENEVIIESSLFFSE